VYSLLFQFLCIDAFANEFSGQVTQDDIPLSNVTLYLFDVNQQYRETQSDSQGNFAFTNLPEGPVRLLAVPAIESDAIPVFYPNTADYCTAERLQIPTVDDFIALDLETGDVFESTLMLNNTPVEGALLKVSPDSGWTRGGFSDENGVVTVGGLPQNKALSIEIEGTDIPTQWMTNTGMTYDSREAAWLDITDVDDNIIDLYEGIEIGGLIHSGPTPIPNANISIYSNSQIQSAVSDDNGLYSVRGLPPGEVLSWMSAEGYANTYSPSDDRPLYFEPVISEGMVYDLLDIDVPLESTFTITLLDANTEEPIQGASILLYNDTKTVGRGEPVDETGTATVYGLHAGQYTVTIFAENDGYYNGDVEDVLGEPLWIEVETESDTEIIVYWEPRDNALLRIVDDLGSPISSVLTLLQHTTTEDYQREYSDSDGYALMYGLQSGTWDILISHTPVCPNDMGYIIPASQSISIPTTETVDIILLRDHDQDGMPTSWEEEWGLDPYQDDANEDPDEDGLSNLQEYQLGSQPTTFDSPSECGCQDSKSALLWIGPLLWVRRRTNRV